MKMDIQMIECKYMLEIDFEDWDHLDVEDLCSAYIDTRKRLLCGDEDNKGNHLFKEATVHLLADSFSFKIKKRNYSHQITHIYHRQSPSLLLLYIWTRSPLHEPL
eukprot:1116969_1